MKQKKWIIIGLVIGLLLIQYGCATIFNGTEQRLVVRSEPSGAKVTIGNRVAKTPATITIKKRGHYFGYLLTIEKEGYKTYTTEVKTRLNPMILLNFAGLNVLGICIDVISGADRVLACTLIDVRLEKEDIKDKLSKLEDEKKQLQNRLQDRLQEIDQQINELKDRLKDKGNSEDIRHN